jgi:hypothetical protein
VLRVEKKRKPQHCLRGLSVRGGWEEGGCRPRTSHQSERKRKANKPSLSAPAEIACDTTRDVFRPDLNGFVTDSGRASRSRGFARRSAPRYIETKSTVASQPPSCGC